MKNTILSFSAICTLIVCLFIGFACNKTNDPSSCETVIKGAAYLKVINNSGEKILVNMTKSIGLGASLNAGACERYGFPVRTLAHTVVFENAQGTKSKTMQITFTQSGEEQVVTVGTAFF